MTSLSTKVRDSQWQSVEGNGSLYGDYIKTSHPIRSDHKEIGTVEIQLTDKFMNDELRQLRRNIILSAVLLSLSLILSITVSFQRMVARPLRQLNMATERMSMGDFNISIPIISNNEIGLLAQSVERLKTSTRLAMEQLSRHK
jgi:HAMP domain-containing protein